MTTASHIDTQWLLPGSTTSLVELCDTYFKDHPQARAELERDEWHHIKWLQDARVLEPVAHTVLQTETFAEDPGKAPVMVQYGSRLWPAHTYADAIRRIPSSSHTVTPRVATCLYYNTVAHTTVPEIATPKVAAPLHNDAVAHTTVSETATPEVAAPLHNDSIVHSPKQGTANVHAAAPVSVQPGISLLKPPSNTSFNEVCPYSLRGLRCQKFNKGTEKEGVWSCHLRRAGVSRAPSNG